MADGIFFVVGAALAVALLACEHLGSTIRKKSETRTQNLEKHNNRTSHILTSTFGLLALLIGFTFSIALNRHDTRRLDVVLEANAIGTAHYRAGMIDPQYGKPLQDSLLSYAQRRISYGKADLNGRKQEQVVSNELRNKIGNAGMLVKPVAQTPLGTSIVASVNEVLDMGAQREANMNARVPAPVFAVLIGICGVAAGLMGFTFPLSGKLRQSSSLLLFALLAMTIMVILDLDRPARGSIRIDQGPMERLVADLGSA